MSYVSFAEQAAYGLTGATQQQLDAASTLIDAFLKRPEGLTWSPDFTGAPCYMTSLTASLSLTAGAPIVAGSNVVVPVPAWAINPDMIGEVLVLDRAVTGRVEACVVTAMAPGAITLASVQTSHSTGATIEAGLCISEERSMPARRAVTRVSRTPVVRLFAGQGRYGYGRRSQQALGGYQAPDLAATLQMLGGPAQWILFDAAQASISNTTGEVWIPPGLYTSSFTDVRLRYVAGWSASAIPAPVKRACASAVAAMQATPELSGSMKSFQAGGTKIERFADSMLDVQTQRTLDSFSAQLLY